MLLVAGRAPASDSASAAITIRQVVDVISTSGSKLTPTTSHRLVQPRPYWRKSSKDKSKAAELWEFKIYRCRTHHRAAERHAGAHPVRFFSQRRCRIHARRASSCWAPGNHWR
ncbi:hypothetical protein VPH35_116544 [Triticum aestivum]